MLREEAEKIRAEEARKKQEAERQRQAQARAGAGKGRGGAPRRKPGPAKRSPAREWLKTAAWTAAGLQGIGLFCTLTLLADSKSLHITVGRKRLAGLLGCSAGRIGHYLLTLEGLGMIRRRCHKKAGAGGVRSVLDVWINRPPAVAGERLPGMAASARGQAPGENGAENALPGDCP
jgi:hypothetical protein